MPVDDVQIPKILWLLFAIPLWLMAFTVGNETAESRKQIEMEKSLEYNDESRKQIEKEKSLEYNDAAIYSSNEYEK